MVRNPDIEYINKFYVHGSEAKVIEFAPNKTQAKTSLPKPLREKKTTIEVDPLALCGIIVAAVMILVMVAGLVDFKAAVDENRMVAEQLEEIRNKHITLEYDYRNSYDPAEVAETAKALGMVPANTIPVVVLNVTVPEETPEYTVWGDFLWSLSCLFRE